MVLQHTCNMTPSHSERHRVFRGRWLRTAVGGLLVSGSVIGVLSILNTSSQTMTVMVALSPLVPGTEVLEADLRRVAVPVHSVFDGALRPSDIVAPLFATGPVAAGEIIPRGAVSTSSPTDDSIVTLELAVGEPAWLRPGAVAELWVSPPEGANGFGAPFVVSPRVVVTAVSREDGFAANSLSSRADILVPRRDLPGVIHALANGFFISVTPVTGPGR